MPRTAPPLSRGSTPPINDSALPVVVIAGGAGFLGAQLSEALLHSGVSVIALDDFITSSQESIEAFKHHPRYQFFDWNINQGIPPALRHTKITHVVQAAAVDVHPGNGSVTLASLLTSGFGTKYLLDLALEHRAQFLLISSMNVYAGLASSTSLTNYFGASLEEDAHYSHLEAQRYAETLCETYVREYHLDARVARFSELYGPQMDLRHGSLLANLLRSTLVGEDLTVTAEGSEELILTYITDAAYALLRFMFAEGERFERSIYTFGNPEKVSVLSIVYTLKEFLPEGKDIIFAIPEKRLRPESLTLSIDRARRDLLWEPTILLSDGLMRTVRYFRQFPPKLAGDDQASSAQLDTMSAIGAPIITKHPKPSLKHRLASTVNLVPVQDTIKPPPVQNPDRPQPVSRRNSASWWRRLFFGATVAALYLVVGRPVVHGAIFTASASWQMRQGITQLQAGNFRGAADRFTAADARFGWASTSFDLVLLHAQLYRLLPHYGRPDIALQAGSSMARSLASMSLGIEPLVVQWHDLTGKLTKADATTLVQRSTTAVTHLHEAQLSLQQAMVLLGSSSTGRVAGASTSQPEVSLNNSFSPWLSTSISMQKIMSLLSLGQEVLTISPRVLASDGQATYLLMLQNSNELRPTGGFLGSYALVQLDHGTIRQFKIDTIYNPDGLLKSHVPAPAAITQTFGGQKLRLVDANWSPSVPESATSIAALYEQATGQKIDGVGFVTIGVLRSLLSLSGPLQLPSSHETVTADNFATLAQVHSDVGFVAGSTAKQDFLGELGTVLFTHFQQQSSRQALPILQVLLSSVAQRDIQLYSRDVAVEHFLDQHQWSGRPLDSGGDYLSVVDANIAANKSNADITRSTRYAVDVDRDGRLLSTVDVQWVHRGTSVTWPGGNYLSYVRVYVPLGSQLVSTEGWRDNSVTTTVESGKTVFGGYMVVLFGTTGHMQVHYRLPASLSLNNQEGSYRLIWQKQSGISDESVATQFNLPAFLATTFVSTGGTQVGSSIKWTSTGAAVDSCRLGLKDLILQ